MDIFKDKRYLPLQCICSPFNTEHLGIVIKAQTALVGRLSLSVGWENDLKR